MEDVKYTLVDTHTIDDQQLGGIKAILAYIENYKLKGAIVSCGWAVSGEPKKSDFAYSVQKLLLASPLTRWIARLASSSFYNKQRKLRLFWRVFSAGKSLQMNLNPDNFQLLSKISPFSRLQMWWWLKPDDINSLNDVPSNSWKIFGYQIHLQTHHWDRKDLDQVMNMVIKVGPRRVYIVGAFGMKKKVLNLIRNFPEINFVVGYGGFPYFDSFMKEANSLENLWLDTGSNHLSARKRRKMLSCSNSLTEHILFATDFPYGPVDQILNEKLRSSANWLDTNFESVKERG